MNETAAVQKQDIDQLASVLAAILVEQRKMRALLEWRFRDDPMSPPSSGLPGAAPAPRQEKSGVRIQSEPHRLSAPPSDGASDRRMAASCAPQREAGHEPNCLALIFDGDDRAAVDERRCTCQKRLNPVVAPAVEKP
jgi:hypothetical protein